ncbi:MAG TPA: glycoside hydrolase family 18 protein [Terriglobia bacterium]|nr:glycoside hydrolase family 18 protein [Terriglobia bacterium]
MPGTFRRPRAAFGLFLAGLLSACGGGSIPGPSGPNPPTLPAGVRVISYYPDWAKTNTPAYSAAQIPYGKLTHIEHAFLTIDPSANGDLMPDANLLEPQLIQMAHAHGVKVLISVGGGDGIQGPALNVMAADPVAVSNFIAQLKTFVTSNGYDGVDIDWEIPITLDDANRCTAVMQALRTALPPPALISMAVTSNPAWPDVNGGYGAFDIPSLTPLVDFFNVMTYDFTGPWADYAGLNSPLYQDPADPDQMGSLKTSVDLYLNTYHVPPAKLNMGTAFYGYRFDGVSSLWETCVPDCSGTVSVNYGPDIKPLINQGWTAQFDSVAQAPYLLKASGTGFITYDDGASTKRKSQYVIGTRGLGGIFSWSLNADYDGSSQDLLDAMYQGALP